MKNEVIKFLFGQWLAFFIVGLAVSQIVLQQLCPSSHVARILAFILMFGMVFFVYRQIVEMRHLRVSTREVKIKIMRMERKVPDHIPDKQVLKYVKCKKNKDILN